MHHSEKVDTDKGTGRRVKRGGGVDCLNGSKDL